jgi:hypothetical protein
VRLRPRRVAGERVLAAATAPEGELAGTRDALLLPDGTRLPWERVEAADWDRDTATFRVTAVADWGEATPSYAFTLDEPDRLLQLVRERVTASIVLQRHVPITGAADGGRGVRVIARRAPGGARELSWFFEYDAGLDPDDPFVAHAAQEALAAARDEVGDFIRE